MDKHPSQEGVVIHLVTELWRTLASNAVDFCGIVQYIVQSLHSQRLSQVPGEHIPSASSALCLQITSPVLASLLGPKRITEKSTQVYQHWKITEKRKIRYI